MDHLDTDLQPFQDLNNHNQCNPTLKTSWEKIFIYISFCGMSIYSASYKIQYVYTFLCVFLELELCHIPKAQTKPYTRYWTILTSSNRHRGPKSNLCKFWNFLQSKLGMTGLSWNISRSEVSWWLHHIQHCPIVQFGQ